MNLNLTIRYALEMTLIFPTIIFALMPVTHCLKVKSLYACITAVIALALCIFAGAYCGVYHKLRVCLVLVPLGVIVFLVYVMAVNADFGKKMFCFFNAVMLCVTCPMYASFVTAPIEILNFSGVLMISSCLVSLALALVIGVIFFRTLTVKIPILLGHDSIRDIWKHMFLIPLVMSALIYWMTPISARVVMTGRVRPISLVLVTMVVVMIFVLYHIFWWITARLTESAELRRENELLSLEAKRYNALRNYMNETRELRHDFRHHIFVISELSGNDRIPELREYISHLAMKAGLEGENAYKSYCANHAADAIASHYDRIASSQDTVIAWRLELPHALPVKEPDFCAILGNLLENALIAVRDLNPPEKRRVNVISSMLSDVMLGLSIDNPYSGAIIYGDNGLPVSVRKGHGTGLISVMNTVKHYGGTMNINTDNNIFTADIILNCTGLLSS